MSRIQASDLCASSSSIISLDGLENVGQGMANKTLMLQLARLALLRRTEYPTFFLEGHKKQNALLFYTRTRFPFRCTNQAIIKSRYLFRYSLKGVTNIRRHDVLRMLVTYLYPYHEYINTYGYL